MELWFGSSKLEGFHSIFQAEFRLQGSLIRRDRGGGRERVMCKHILNATVSIRAPCW